MENAKLARYQRQIGLPHIGEAGQQRLLASKVLCVGAGGLGSPALLYLAAAGVGTIGIVDPDRVELSNLHRQVLYTQVDLDQYKVDAAHARLTALNSDVTIVCYRERLTEHNAQALIASYDFVIDGSDNFATRYLINDACYAQNTPFIFASIYQFEGQCALFTGQQGPCYRCLFPFDPANIALPTCEDAGVLGTLPGLLGSLQANETLKYLLQFGTPLTDRFFQIDTATLAIKQWPITPDPDCLVCQQHLPFDALPRPAATCTLESDEIEIAELAHRLQRGDQITLIDVRKPYEIERENLGGLAIPLAQLSQAIDQLPRDHSLICYCEIGARSLYACELLKAAGFKDVKNLSGGMHAARRSQRYADLIRRLHQARAGTV